MERHVCQEHLSTNYVYPELVVYDEKGKRVDSWSTYGKQKNAEKIAALPPRYIPGRNPGYTDNFVRYRAYRSGGVECRLTDPYTGYRAGLHGAIPAVPSSATGWSNTP